MGKLRKQVSLAKATVMVQNQWHLPQIRAKRLINFMQQTYVLRAKKKRVH
jgi:hypothetical protein